MVDWDEATPTANAEGRRRITPLDVQQKEFRVSFRGYHEREVDEFLDLVTEELQRYEAELMRLRSERNERTGSVTPSFDADAEAQRIIRKAREQADAIVRDAEARAAAIPTASAAETRAVVAPYLNREREFLQRLGGLVQEHAQTIKTMVEEARRRTEPAPTGGIEPAPSSRTTETRTNGDERPPRDAAGDVVVVGTDERRRAEPEDEREPEGARSLRELFWRED